MRSSAMQRLKPMKLASNSLDMVTDKEMCDALLERGVTDLTLTGAAAAKKGRPQMSHNMLHNKINLQKQKIEKN